MASDRQELLLSLIAQLQKDHDAAIAAGNVAAAVSASGRIADLLSLKVDATSAAVPQSYTVRLNFGNDPSVPASETPPAEADDDPETDKLAQRLLKLLEAPQ